MSLFTLLDSLLHRYRARPRVELTANICTRTRGAATIQTDLTEMAQMRAQITMSAAISAPLALMGAICTHQRHEASLS